MPPSMLNCVTFVHPQTKEFINRCIPDMDTGLGLEDAQEVATTVGVKIHFLANFVEACSPSVEYAATNVSDSNCSS